MVEYVKTQKGYFYKLYKNGEKKRISREEYGKKIKKITGGTEPIKDKDIKYKDDLVCILHPEVKKGILIRTNYVQPLGAAERLCNSGLKTGKLLNEQGISFDQTIYHPYIFFRAPYYSTPIDYSSVDSEIRSVYGDNSEKESSMAYIRIDPEQTYVFSSEIRNIFKHSVWYKNVDTVIQKSKKTLSQYLKIIDENRIVQQQSDPNKKIWYNLFSSQAVSLSIHHHPVEPFDAEPIERNSEILVSIPHLTPDYFVKCT